MKKEKIAFNILMIFGFIVLTLCIIFIIISVLYHNFDNAASWAEAFGSLSAVLVTLWATLRSDLQNKEEKYNHLLSEIRHLKNIHSELSKAQGYNCKDYLKNNPSLTYEDTWYQHWHDYLPQLIELRNILDNNGMQNQNLNDFIKYIENGNRRELNDQLGASLLTLRLIYEWKEKQLNDME